MSVDGLGNPLRFLLTPGQRHDVSQANPLSADLSFDYLIADTAYDAQDFLDFVLAQGAQPVIPPRANRKQPRDYDTHVYKERHLAECFINKIKHYRRIFSRFDKLDCAYLGFLNLAGALIWLR